MTQIKMTDAEKARRRALIFEAMDYTFLDEYGQIVNFANVVDQFAAEYGLTVRDAQAAITAAGEAKRNELRKRGDWR